MLSQKLSRLLFSSPIFDFGIDVRNRRKNTHQKSGCTGIDPATATFAIIKYKKLTLR